MWPSASCSHSLTHSESESPTRPWLSPLTALSTLLLLQFLSFLFFSLLFIYLLILLHKQERSPTNINNNNIVKHANETSPSSPPMWPIFHLFPATQTPFHVLLSLPSPLIPTFLLSQSHSSTSSLFSLSLRQLYFPFISPSFSLKWNISIPKKHTNIFYYFFQKIMSGAAQNHRTTSLGLTSYPYRPTSTHTSYQLAALPTGPTTFFHYFITTLHPTPSKSTALRYLSKFVPHYVWFRLSIYTKH